MSRLRDGRHRRGEGHRPLGPLHATGLRPDQPQHESSRNNIFAFSKLSLDSSIVGNRKKDKCREQNNRFKWLTGPLLELSS